MIRFTFIVTVRWPAPLELHLPILTGDSPFSRGRDIRPFLARAGSEIVARAAAVIHQRYQRHWHEPLGHIIMFEALADGGQATRLLMGSRLPMAERARRRSRSRRLRLVRFSVCYRRLRRRCRPSWRARIPLITIGS